jgi:hypothetical protein
MCAVAPAAVLFTQGPGPFVNPFEGIIQSLKSRSLKDGMKARSAPKGLS